MAAEAGAISLTGLELAENVIGVHLSGAAEASLAGATIVGGIYGLYLRGAAKLSMQGGEIRDVGPACATRAALSLDATSLTLEGVSVHDNAAWVEVGDVATATLEGSTFTSTGAACGAAIAARDTSRGAGRRRDRRGEAARRLIGRLSESRFFFPEATREAPADFFSCPEGAWEAPGDFFSCPERVGEAPGDFFSCREGAREAPGDFFSFPGGCGEAGTSQAATRTRSTAAPRSEP